MHLHFQSNQKKCKVRHGASNNHKVVRVFPTREFQTESRWNFGKGQGLARGKRKRKGNARILASKEKKKFNCKIRGVTRVHRDKCHKYHKCTYYIAEVLQNK
jgi:hypothetical protein